MTKYLDENGLAYFWTKIKAWLSSHAPVKYFGQNWVEDTNNDYALVVGDGVDENNLENAAVIRNDGVFVKNISSVNANTSPASDTYHAIIAANDGDDERRGFIELVDFQSGFQGIDIGAQRYVNGSNVYNVLKLSLDQNGEPGVSFGNEECKEIWQTALNYWRPDFWITHKTADAKQANNGVSGVQYPAFNISDKDKRILARLECPVHPTGEVGFGIQARNYDSSGNQLSIHRLALAVDKNDVGSWTVSDNKSFRKALGLGQSDGAFPLTIGQGGTGANIIDYFTTASSLITPASGITVNSIAILRWGRLVQMAMSFKKSTAISVTADGDVSDFTIGTLKSGYRPGFTIYFIGTNSGSHCRGSIGANGEIRLLALEGTGSARSLPANTNIYISGFWMKYND